MKKELNKHYFLDKSLEENSSNTLRHKDNYIKKFHTPIPFFHRQQIHHLNSKVLSEQK